MNSRFGWLSLVLAGIICLPAFAVDDKKDKETTKTSPEETGSKDKKAGEKKDEFKATCPVSGSAAKKEQMVGYKDKEVYFCCDKCKAAYEADSAKYATKANFQLVQTKQFRQTACPLSGGKVNKEQSVKVDGVKVTFCCDKCKGAIESASKDDQLTKIFAEDVFAKSFAAKKADGESKKEKSKTEAKEGEKATEDKA